MRTPLQRLTDHGQSVWINFLSRELLRSGELARLMREDAVSGVTSNPTIFRNAISAGDAYDDQLRDLVETEDDLKEIFIQLASKDVGDACDLFRSVWDEVAAAATATSRSKSTPTSPMRRTPRSQKRSACTS
jgi:transaldolase